MITTTQTTKPEIIGSLLGGGGYSILHADFDVASGSDFFCCVAEYDASQFEPIADIGQLVDAVLILPDILISAHDARVLALDVHEDRSAFVILLVESKPHSFRAH